MRARYRDRADAGRALGKALLNRAGPRDTVVLGIPRGGVAVGLEVARAIQAPFDIFVVETMSLVVSRAMVIGAVASGGVTVLDEQKIMALDLPRDRVDRMVVDAWFELDERESAFRGLRAPTALRGRTVVLVDDGLSPGPTLLAAVNGVRMFEPLGVIVAAPVARAEASEWVRDHVEQIVAAEAGAPGRGGLYDDASEPSDDDVRAALSGLRPRFPWRTQSA